MIQHWFPHVNAEIVEEQEETKDGKKQESPEKSKKKSTLYFKKHSFIYYP